MTDQFDYDLFVIGAGSGGVRAARMAAGKGKRVAIAEERYLGGTCVNVGCVPKKVMWFGAHVAEAINLYAPDYGFDVTVNSFNWQTLVNSREAYIKRIHASYGSGFEKNGVFLVVVNGSIEVDGIVLHKRDALGISETNAFNIKASEDSELLAIEVPMGV